MASKDTFKTKSFKQFKDHHFNSLSLELQTYIAERKKTLPNWIRFFLHRIYLLCAFILSLIALSLFVAFTRVNDIETDGHTISFILLGISIGVLIISLGMLIAIAPIKAKASRLLQKSLNEEEIYELIFSHFPFLDLDETSAETISELRQYYDRGYPNINENAEMWKASKLFNLKHKKHLLEYQTQAWKWPDVQNKENFFYANIGMIVYHLSEEEIDILEDFKFSLVKRILIDPELKNVNLDNMHFNRRYHLRSNNDWIARKLFSEHTVEKMLKLWKLTNAHNYQIQLLNNKIVIKFIPSAPKVLRISFSYHENSKSEIDSFCRNLIDDIYQLRVILWTIESIKFSKLMLDKSAADSEVQKYFETQHAYPFHQKEEIKPQTEETSFEENQSHHKNNVEANFRAWKENNSFDQDRFLKAFQRAREATKEQQLSVKTTSTKDTNEDSHDEKLQK